MYKNFGGVKHLFSVLQRHHFLRTQNSNNSLFLGECNVHARIMTVARSVVVQMLWRLTKWSTGHPISLRSATFCEHTVKVLFIHFLHLQRMKVHKVLLKRRGVVTKHFKQISNGEQHGGYLYSSHINIPPFLVASS